jgi:hypothetical protein
LAGHARTQHSTSRQSANALLGISVMWYQWWLSGLARRIMNN